MHVATLLQKACILTVDSQFRIIPSGFVAIDAGKIVALGDMEKWAERNITADTVLDCSNKIIMPALINTHTHIPMVYFRGVADDMPLFDWLENYIWPLEHQYLSPTFCHDATLLGLLEMIRSGIGTFSDMYFFEDAIAQACLQAGVRSFLGEGILDFPTVAGRDPQTNLAFIEEFLQQYANDDLIFPIIAPHGTYTVSPPLLEKAWQLAQKYNCPFHIHMAENESEIKQVYAKYAKSPYAILADQHIEGSQILAAHSVYPNKSDIEWMQQHQISVVHCAESNLKLGSGIAPIPKYVQAGINVALGTDGAASNNNLSILEEMHTVAKLHKGYHRDSTLLPAQEVLKMATINGAKALGIDAVTGSLEVGKSADLLLMDTHASNMQPLFHPVSQVVYAAHESNISDLMVRGQWLMRNQKVQTLDEEAILQKAQQMATQIHLSK